MELYIGPLDSHTTLSDLQRFFKNFGKKAKFQLMKLIRNNGSHYYGLVDIDSDRLAQKAIKKLHASRLDQRRVIVREYSHRASNNDRRALNWRNQEWSKVERRNDERRQKCKLKGNRKPEFDGYANMSVKHL